VKLILSMHQLNSKNVSHILYVPQKGGGREESNIFVKFMVLLFSLHVAI
jgi:hypothetical protein